MEFHEFIQQVKLHRQKIYGVIAIFLVLAAGVVALQRFKYGSKSQVLVVQEYSRTLDAYTVSRSNEYLSSILASVITSNSFFTKVLESGFEVNKDYFGDTPRDQMKEWLKTVSARSINDSGIISIAVYHPDRTQAEKIIRAVNHVLMTQHTAYHGSGDSVKIRLIDQPVTSNFPVKPNIPLIVALAVALGLVSSLVYIYLLPIGAKPSSGESGRFAEIMKAAGVSEHFARQPHNVASVRISGQAPEEALEQFQGAAPTPRPQTPYGQYEQFQRRTEADEGGYLEEDFDALPPERLVRQGDIRNILQ